MFKRSTELVRVEPLNLEPEDTDNVRYKCEFCPEEWCSEVELHYHKKIHFLQLQNRTRSIPFICWSCIKPLKTKATLISHLKVRHLLSSIDAQRVEREIFVCDRCDCIFFNKSMLILHTKVRHGMFKKKLFFDCPKCNKRVQVANCWNHMNLHGIIALRVCPICFEKFENWKSLRLHSKKHQLYLYCNICNLNFDKQNHYLLHLEEKHKHIETNESDNKVIKVNKYFVPNNWKISKVRFKNLLPYQGLQLQGEVAICVLCREMCTTYEEKEAHIIQHTIETPDRIEPIVERKLPTCSCGETFTYKILLKQHLSRNKGSDPKHIELCSIDTAKIAQDNQTELSVDEKI